MRRLVLLAAVVAGLAVATAAQAKGPIAATIDGPGPSGGISLGGNGEPGSGAPLGNLADQSGLFPAAFRQSPDPMLADRPTGDLGPRYTITYRLPGPNGEESTIRQNAYPNAQGGPVTYTAPGQRFFGTESTRGGWYRAAPALKATVLQAGQPRAAPSGGSASEDSGGTTFANFWPAIVAVLLIGLAPLLALLARLRVRAAAS
jgi:hypothetical protein